MALKDHPLMIVLAVALATAASVEYGVVQVEVLSQNVKPYSTWIFILGLGGAYLISERAIGNMDDWEMGAFVVGLGSFAFHEFIPQFQSFVTANQPHSGIVLTFATMIAFYILTREKYSY